MGIIWVREHWSGRTGPWRYDGVRRYVRVFHVLTDSPTIDSNEVIFARDQQTNRKVSSLGDPYVSYDGLGDDPGAICTNVDPRADSNNPQFWEVNCTFESPDHSATGGRGSDGSSGGGGRVLAPHRIARDPFVHSDPTQGGNRGSTDEKNPFLQFPSISWTAVKRQYYVPKDLDGNPIVNKANDPIEGGMPVDTNDAKLTIVRNEPDYDRTSMAPYENTLNKETFMGYEPEEVKCEAITGQLVQQASYIFFQVTYEFSCIRFVLEGDTLRTWNYTPLNAGYYERDDSRPTKRPPIESNGIPVATPWPLDADGFKLDANSTAYVYLNFRRYRKKSFNPLRLPFPWL